MEITECIHTNSGCFKRSPAIGKVAGVVVHSTGADNPYLRRYVCPSGDDPRKEELLLLLGKNRYGNHWNRNINKAVHYFVGRDWEGRTRTVRVLPEEIACWGCGKGKKGSYNYSPNGHIQFEVCEGSGPEYFRQVFDEAAGLAADICARYGLPVSAVVSHREAHLLGYASNHGDIDSFLKKNGSNMELFRAKVAEILGNPGQIAEQSLSLEQMDSAEKTDFSTALGKTVKIRPGAHWINGGKVPDWLYRVPVYLRRLEKEGAVALISIYPDREVYTGRISTDLLFPEKK